MPIAIFIASILYAVSQFHYFSPITNRILDILPGGHSIEILNYISLAPRMALVIIGCLVFEVFVVGWKRSSLQRLIANPTNSAVSDVIIVLLSWTGIFTILGSFFSFNLDNMIASQMSILGKFFSDSGWNIDINSLNISNWQKGILYFVFLDFINYWVHRVAHNVSFWWETHKIHHSAKEFTLITLWRNHPFYNIFIAFFAGPLVIFTPYEIASTLLTVSLAHQLLIHSQLTWSFGWVGRWIFVSPVAHRIHHSDLPEHRDLNFAFSFIIWDRLFGSYYKGEMINKTIGLIDGQYADSTAIGLMLGPVFEVYMMLIRKIAQIVVYAKAKLQKPDRERA